MDSVKNFAVKDGAVDGGEVIDGGDGVVKKGGVWKPVNGVVEVVGIVMGDDHIWPALGEAVKSGSSESLSAVSDGVVLVPALQVTGNSSPLSHKPESVKSVNLSVMPNHVASSGQRPTKQGGVSSGAHISSNGRGGVSQRAPASQESKVEANNSTSSGKPGTVAVDSHTKESMHKEAPRGGGFGSQPNSGNNDHHHQRNAYRRGNGGQHPRGDGSYHHSYAGKVDQGQGRENQEWNQDRNFNNRYTNMQPQRGNRRGAYMRPSVHNPNQFTPPPMPVPMGPFANNVMYPDVGPAMIYVQGPTPFVGPSPVPMYYPASDPVALWNANIMNQIDYYFSNENLVKDTYLRRNMDEQGWVSASLIAGFKKVKALTNNVEMILDAMKHSTVVEVQDDKIRRVNDWMRWLMPPPAQYSSETVPRSFSQDPLASQLQGIALDEATSKNEVHAEIFSSRSSSSGNFSIQFQHGAGGDHRSSQQSGFEQATMV